MNGSIVRVLIVLLCLGCCSFHGCLNPIHRIFLWNHSDYDLVVISGNLGGSRLYITNNVRPGEKRMLCYTVSAGTYRDGDSLGVKILLADSLIYQQDTLSTKLWEIQRREDLSTAVSYTLHVFNASTRQPGH